MRTTSASVRRLRQRLEQHRRFWARGHQAVPPASFRVGDFFFSRHFEAARPLLARNRLIKPDDLELVHKGLPRGGLCLHIAVPTLEEAKARHAYIQSWE